MFLDCAFLLQCLLDVVIYTNAANAVLGLGAAEKRVIPGAGPDQFEFGSFMSVTLSCDHRVIDGMCDLTSGYNNSIYLYLFIYSFWEIV